MKRREPKWVDRLVAEAIHWDQIREHGGLAGIRDENALESALARGRQRWHYEPETDLPALAAAIGFGLSKNHPFRDGNKRVSFVVMIVFLELNGWSFATDEEDVVRTIVSLAAGDLTEFELAAWLRTHARRRKGGR